MKKNSRSAQSTAFKAMNNCNTTINICYDIQLHIKIYQSVDWLLFCVLIYDMSFSVCPHWPCSVFEWWTFISNFMILKPESTTLISFLLLLYIIKFSGSQRINLIKMRSLRSLLKDLTKSLIEVKSGDLSIMHDYNVMPRRKLSSDWLNTHVTEQGFR